MYKPFVAHIISNAWEIVKEKKTLVFEGVDWMVVHNTPHMLVEHQADGYCMQGLKYTKVTVEYEE